MDTFRVFLDNSLNHEPKFKAKFKHKFVNSLERIDRDKFANKILNSWWEKIRYSNLFIISPLLWDSLATYYEAVECYREGLFLGCAVLCRASIEDIVYSIIQSKASLEVSRIIREQHNNQFFMVEFGNPYVIRYLANPKNKNPSNITRSELYKAGKMLGVLDTKLIKRIESAMEKGDIIMHYDESVHKISLKREREYSKDRNISDESMRKFSEHIKPLLDNKRTKILLKETADILADFSEKARNW